MKRIIVVLVVMCVSLLANAQTQRDSVSEHMKFKGVEIDGDVNVFVKKMKDEGFVYQEKDDNLVIMKGKFLNKDCILFILCTPQSNIACKVIIFLDKQTSWVSLKRSYFEVKDLFSKKYGKPDDYEFFSKPYYEGDGYELQALKNEKCSYTSFWTLKNGMISVNMANSCKVAIVYEDAINMQKMKKEKEKEALEEI